MIRVFNNDFDKILADIENNIIWQYDNAEHLKNLINFKKNFVKLYHCDFWKDFEKNIFNIEIANEFGLTLWGAILNVNRNYTVDGENKKMSVELYRQMLKGRLYYMTMNCSDSQIRTYLKMITGEDKTIVDNTKLNDNEDMTINYVLTWTPTQEELELYFNTDILPRPAGVKIILYQIDKNKIFGFRGSNLKTFNQGVFWSGQSLNRSSV